MRGWALFLALGACRGDDEAPGGGDDDDDSGIDDSGIDDTGEVDEGPITDLSARVHDELGSLVYVSWEQDVAGTATVQYRVGEGDWQDTPTLDAEAGSHEQLVLGIPYGTDFDYRVSVASDDGTILSGEKVGSTDPVPEALPDTVVHVSEADLQDADLRYLMLSQMGLPVDGDQYIWTFIIDRGGQVVWARQTPDLRVTLHAQASYDGHTLLLDHNSYWATFDGGEDSQVQRITIDGEVLATYDTPGLHHPFTELADGSLAWTTRDGQWERIVTLSPEGEQATVWDCEAWHKEREVNAYCGSNTLRWNEATDTFLYSSYSTDTVVEVDHQTGDVLRWFGHIDGAWAFADDETAFWWQHGAHLTSDGTLLVSARAGEWEEETVIREYSLDDKSETLTQVWTFGEGEGIYAKQMGEAERLAGGNTLHNLGSEERVREITPAGEVAWDIAWPDGEYLGRTTAISDLYDFAP